MSCRPPLRPPALLASLCACVLALGLVGCDDGRSTWDDLEEQGIEDPRDQGVGGLAKSVTESTTGTTAPDVVEASDLTARGLEATRAEAVVEEIRGALDGLRAQEGYEAWRDARLGEGPEPLYLGSAESIRGLARLSDEEVLAWADLQRAMLGHVHDDEATCASYAEGDVDLRTAIELHNALSVEEVRRRTRLVLRGLRAELAAEGTLPRAPRRAMGAALGELMTAIEEAGGDGDRFVALAEIADKSDSELCELNRTIYRHMSDIEPADRLVLLFGVTR